jgi:hypothetical protein
MTCWTGPHNLWAETAFELDEAREALRIASARVEEVGRTKKIPRRVYQIALNCYDRALKRVSDLEEIEQNLRRISGIKLAGSSTRSQ